MTLDDDMGGWVEGGGGGGAWVLGISTPCVCRSVDLVVSRYATPQVFGVRIVKWVASLVTHENNGEFLGQCRSDSVAHAGFSLHWSLA